MQKHRSHSLDDAALVAQIIASQSTQAFGELVQRHQSQIRAFMRKLTRDPDLADDLSQDAFLHAWDKIHTYSGSGSFIGWLLKVAYTTFLQSRRRSNRYGEILEEMGRSPLKESAATQQDEASDLDKFLAVLSEEERAVMILSYACGLSHREIGEATGQPLGTIKSIIFRGKEKIRESFDIERHQYG